MKQQIAHIALVVADYDEAIRFYTETLGFLLIEDTPQTETKRWVLVAPKNSDGCQLLLAKGVGDEQISRIGNQTGGRVFLFLQTDDFWRDYNEYLSKGVKFVREPKVEDYGIVAVFADLYGNLWDLIEFDYWHKFESALKKGDLFSAERYARKLDFGFQIAESLTAIARKHFEFGEHDKAFELLTESVDFARADEDSESLQNSLDGSSVLWEITEEFALSGNIEKAKSICESIKDEMKRNRSVENLAKIAKGEKGDFQRSREK